MIDARAPLVLLAALLGAGPAVSRRADGGEGPGKAAPPAAEIVRVIKGGTLHEASTLTIDIIERYKRGGLPESVPLIRELVRLHGDARLPEKRRRKVMALIAMTGGAEAAHFLVRELGAGAEDVLIPAARAAGKLLARHRGKGDAAFEPESVADAMENLAEALVDVAEDGPDEARGAAIEALGKAKVKQATRALIEILREEPELAPAANDALQGISGRALPADPDSWESWRYHATTRPEQRETDKERSEGLVLPAGDDGGIEMPPTTLSRLKGSWKYVLAAACGVGVVVFLVLAKFRQTRRWAEKIEARRRKIRRRSS
jgi:hypothetical protein